MSLGVLGVHWCRLLAVCWKVGTLRRSWFRVVSLVALLGLFGSGFFGSGLVEPAVAEI